MLGRSTPPGTSKRARRKTSRKDSAEQGVCLISHSLLSMLITLLLSKIVGQIHKVEVQLQRPMGAAKATILRAEASNYEAQIKTLDIDIDQIQNRMSERKQSFEQGGQAAAEQPGNQRLPNESQRDFLIRTGKITPFSKMPGYSLKKFNSTLQEILLDAEEDNPDEQEVNLEMELTSATEPRSHRNLLQPGFADDAPISGLAETGDFFERPMKRRKLQENIGKRNINEEQETSIRQSKNQSKNQSQACSEIEETDDETFKPDTGDREIAALGESEDQNSHSDLEPNLDIQASKRDRRGRKVKKHANGSQEDLVGLDDGDERLYQIRLDSWVARRSDARQAANKEKMSTGYIDDSPIADASKNYGSLSGEPDHASDDFHEEECYMPHPTRPDTEFSGDYRIPGDIYPSLFDYQKTGVQWLWELYSQQVGGIIGDEMGLGKTIQAISFLAGLHYSKKITKPIIIVTPATVMRQWVNEFHTWWPPFRVSILHTSGSGMMNLGRESRAEYQLVSQEYSVVRKKPLSKSDKAAQRIVDRVVEEGHVLVTTYSGLQTYSELLTPVEWEYAILDEGHKIRNPNTAITIYCKELRTANRIILSGTPMQNNLIELWSLFDFISPLRLGTLVNFRQQFETPIKHGGYANASNLQVQTASRCAETLKDTISPYLLQRFKVDVAADLPKKTEQVLFCKLTKLQREAYETFLASDDMKSILNGKQQVLFGIDILRKICNHPDLQDHRTLTIKSGYDYGRGDKSGKMVIVKELLDMWKKGGHKTLLFAQHRIMLDILEKYIRSIGGINYRRMDGNTPISTRQDMVDQFNNDPDIHVFFLTTKVGGLGVNLTGADRVIIYDPDWNPSTDIQARERAWRLGQKREVQIFRLMIAGTIEEKIFHRQIFKQFLTNKILKDPKQRQTFQLKDLHDLFTLGSIDEEVTETGRLFKGTEVKFNQRTENSTTAPIKDGTASPQSNACDDQVRDMVGVSSIETFQDESGTEGDTSALAESTNSEARILQGIFARSGVHSALEHDQIINGKRVVSADPKMIEREAKKVAAQAAIELRKAGEMAKTIPIGTPTWTGHVGTAGRPDSMARRGLGRGTGRGGISSANILAGLQSRQSTNGPGRGLQTVLPRGGPRGVDFMKLIRDYLVTHSGKVYTQMLIDHFDRHCTTSQKKNEFTEMLKTIATLKKGRNGRGEWTLKDEYKSRV